MYKIVLGNIVCIRIIIELVLFKLAHIDWDTFFKGQEFN